MKTWQSQGINGNTSKDRDVWIFTGERTLDQWRDMFLGNTQKAKDLRAKYLINRNDWNRNGHYQFTGWQTLRNDEIGIPNKIRTNGIPFYTQNFNHSLYHTTVIQGYDANHNIMFPGFTEGHAYWLFRLFKYKPSEMTASDYQDIRFLFFGEGTTFEQDKHNANMMNFLWKYKIPGYNLTSGNVQFRHRNHYYSYPNNIEPEEEENVIEGGAFPGAKPNLNKGIYNYPYPEIPTGVYVMKILSLNSQSVVYGDTYSVYYNTSFFWTWQLMLPVTAKEHAIVRRGFNKWIFDMGNITVNAPEDGYTYNFCGMLVLGR